jgi:hypothetical protein
MADLITAPIVIPFVLGAIIGWCGNWFYYRRARKDAAEGSAITLSHLRTLLEASEKAGNVELVRDGDGRPTGGRVIRAVANAGVLGIEGYAPTVEIRAQSSTVDGAGTRGSTNV